MASGRDGANGRVDQLKRIGDLARALSQLEQGLAVDAPPEPRTGTVVGVVGPPGVGKSSLISSLAARARRDGHTVVVLAVDPSSPITGGALLGDRVRLGAHADDLGTFVRSFASRGYPGGLAAAIPAAVDCALARGWDRVFIEPVGGGQNDVDIAGAADVVLLVVSPESGDEIQALKAGVIEVADVVVVNKADRPGATPLVTALRNSLGRRGERPCFAVSAQDDESIDELAAALATRGAAHAVRSDAAVLTTVLNDATAAVRAQLTQGAARAEVLGLARRGERREAVRRALTLATDD